MDGIKCFWFWKLLKQLFIISLISCFGLLANSFVNAFESVPIWQNTTPPNDTILSISVLPYWSFVSNFLWSWKPVLAFINKALNTTKGQYVYFMWIDWKLYFYSSYLYSSTTTTTWNRQWFVSLYRICDYIWESTTSLSNCTQFNYDEQIVNDFLDTVKLWDYYTVWWKINSTYYYYAWFCASSSVYNKSICFWWENWTYFWLTWSIDIPSQTNFSDLAWYDSQSPAVPITPSNPWGQVWTPWTWSRLSWRLVINSWYTNSDMINWFECVGLQPALCYWWFDIDNIFDPSEQYEDFTWYRAGQGATIFEIYNLYSWNFTSLQQFLNTVLTRYQNWQINSFKTEPKALLMLWAQMNTAWFKTSYIANYCNLLLNENNNNIYTWNSVDDLRVQSCIRSQKIWDSLREWVQDIWFQTTTWWVFSWWDIDFDPDTFFSNIMDTIDRNLNQNLSWWAVGLLPWYIVVIFLGLVFIRLITH